jgi:EAL domain-containing protein (putative c-di-GMP-specific phosphodiesterase class I)/GGDEF domain-containing protein
MIDAQLFAASPVATFVCDTTTLAILEANDRAIADFVPSRDALASLTLLDLVPPADRSSLAEAFAAIGDAETSTLRERRQQLRDGSIVHVDFSISAPIVLGERRARVVIANQVQRRFLRAVPNDRNAPFGGSASETVRSASEHGGSLALVHVTWIASAAQRGHHFRELGARAVSEALARLAPPHSVIARYADDVFAVHVAVGRARTMRTFARHVLHAFERPLSMNGNEVVAIPRIGIAVRSRTRDEQTSIVLDAQAALDAALHGGEQVEFFTEELAGQHERRAVVDRNLRHAISQRRLAAVYQPIVSLHSGDVVGAEALLRWDCPGIGPVPTSEFIAIAEESGMIGRLGEWMLREACAQARRWQLDGAQGFRITINVSPRQVEQRDFVRFMTSICESTQLRAQDLELEIGENALLRNPAAVRNLEALRQLGMRVAVDNFGTGLSALSALGSLPLDVLKIDRAVVEPMGADAYRAQVVRSVIALAHEREIRVVAQGVETAEQAETLRALGCDEGQGFLFGAPAPAEELSAHMERERFRARIAPAPGT